MKNESYCIHYKEKPYRVIGVAKHSETLEDFVVYECLYPNSVAKLWIRPRAMFEGDVQLGGTPVRRFRPVDHAMAFAAAESLMKDATSPVTLLPMTAEHYAEYLERSIADYARDKVKAGNWSQEESLERSRREFHILLPDGLSTPNHFLFTIVTQADGKAVGEAWIAFRPEKKNVYIYDFRLHDNNRGKGLGRAALRLLDQKALELGAKDISLHVFGNNTVAWALYENSGYLATNVNMTKALRAP